MSGVRRAGSAQSPSSGHRVARARRRSLQPGVLKPGSLTRRFVSFSLYQPCVQQRNGCTGVCACHRMFRMEYSARPFRRQEPPRWTRPLNVWRNVADYDAVPRRLT